jgi:prophage tail gpP-like protein
MIWKANQNTLRSGDPNLIFPGEVIQIPGNPVEAPIQQAVGLTAEEYLPGKEVDDFTLIINDKEFVVESARVMRTMDTVTDGWSASIYWDPDDSQMREILKPYQYNPSLVYVGPWLVVKGAVYTVRASLSPNKNVINLEGFSSSADLVDSTVKPPYEQKKITLKRRAIELVEPLGLTVLYEADEGEDFDRVTAQAEDTIFSHLSSLAAQREVLISSNPLGNVVFYQANADSKSVGTIQEDFPPYQSMEAVFDGRARFNAYRVIGPTPKRKSGNALEAISKDEGVPKSRFKTISVTDSTSGNIQKTADWQRSKQIAEALTIPFPVNSWYTPDGELWRENTIVTVRSKSIFVPDGFDFLIKSVEYLFEERGTSAILNLVPPQVYTGEPVEEPWA